MIEALHPFVRRLMREVYRELWRRYAEWRDGKRTVKQMVMRAHQEYAMFGPMGLGCRT